MLKIGCHLSTKRGFLDMAKEIVSIDGNTFQYFTRNPRGGAQKKLDIKDVEAYRAFAKDNGIDVLCAYAPYDVEPASSDMSKRDFTLMVMSEDLARLEEIPGQFYLVRPGSAPGVSEGDAIDNIADVVNRSLSPSMSSMLILDTMAGEGSQIGSTFEQLARIIDAIDLKDKVGVCMDASAVWAAGYDIVGDLDGVLDEFDRTIGLDKLRVVHLNDSKEGLGSKVDRHARIGEGRIGFDALAAMVVDPRLANVAFYLEEPDPDLVVYERDIARFRKASSGE